MNKGAFIAVASLLVLIAASNVAGQSVVSLGAGAANRDESETYGRLLSVSLRHFLTRHLAVEGELSTVDRAWEFFDPGQIVTAPNGAQGFSGSHTAAGRNTEWALATGVVVRTAPRRASAFGSGGVLWLRERSRYSRTYRGCVPPEAFTFSGFCTYRMGSEGDDRTYSTFGYHFGGGVDIRIVGPLVAYGYTQVNLGSNYWLRHVGGLRYVLE
jgi:hypothetical protein